MGWEEHSIDVMAESRRSNIIIKGIPESSMMGDQREVEEILKDLYCRQRINQIKNAGITRLGAKRGGRNRLLMVSFENEEAANQIHERRYMLDGHPYMGNVHIMKDLPRSERRNRRVSNTLNEAANSGGNRTQRNLTSIQNEAQNSGINGTQGNPREENSSIGSMGDRATLTGNQSSINDSTAERVRRVLEGLDGVEERDNEVWTNASTESLEGTGGIGPGGLLRKPMLE